MLRIVDISLCFCSLAARMDGERKYDLEERTAVFGEDVIAFAQGIPVNQITRSLIDQLVRAGTSVGANYCEADDAHTKKEFRHKLSYCRKESRETKHWLRMMAKAVPDCRDHSLVLWKEAHELNLIFSSIIRNSATD
ncbi:four helix bundle protein [Coraliomargarita sp. SDUM461004]|uniref:Four helix bundle protein n=1 Tax=Thalassobacterium sedimentorum TaxID=3041258 RepID=A0ABU1AFY7_9BACT|nr:four helix bundle protein [Coraliomargarita sp. SDUM461004]MDQ8193745.1 four helix bundle protein [Coraliomargarita sp. SDUM461004]